jgi:integral membrane protein (TIGR01906 family)
MNENTSLSKIIEWLAAAVIPFISIMLSVRLLITSLYAQVEYRMPGFPMDPFGFTMEDRLRWAEPSITFLVNSEDITFLEELAFEDGVPIYNQRELSHMQDVKTVVTGMRIALAIFMVAFLILAMLAETHDLKDELLRGCERGGWIVFGIIIAVLVFLLLSFDVLFDWFHQLFFESGTWKFYTSDTLIRLFPMRFWRDAFIAVGILNLLISGVVIFISRRQ